MSERARKLIADVRSNWPNLPEMTIEKHFLLIEGALQAELAAANARITELEAALRPFADYPWEELPQPKMADFHKAAEVLTKGEKKCQ